MIVFDLSRIQTLYSCKSWLDEALEQNQYTPTPHIFLVGNKIDSVVSNLFFSHYYYGIFIDFSVEFCIV